MPFGSALTTKATDFTPLPASVTVAENSCVELMVAPEEGSMGVIDGGVVSKEPPPPPPGAGGLANGTGNALIRGVSAATLCPYGARAPLAVRRYCLLYTSPSPRDRTR